MFKIEITKQEIYNTVVSHLLSMDGRSMVRKGYSCRYRGPNGAMCAAGVLIPDHVYKRTMENTAFTDLCYEGRIDADDNVINFIQDLQEIHDFSLNLNRVKNRAENEKYSGGMNE